MELNNGEVKVKVSKIGTLKYTSNMSPPVADSTKNVEQKCSQRKINKPLIEKRRRARINDCLAQLKTIVLEANETKSPRPSKLEKADILEMTVEFVKNKLNRDNEAKNVKSLTTDDNLDYVAGYSKCLSEISKFLEQTRPEHYTLQQDLLGHVSEKLRHHLTKEEKQGHTKNMPISPVCKPTHKQKCQSEEAIDLSVSNVNSTEQDIVTTADSKTPKELTSLKPATDQLVNHSTPVGLLCGGQVMLLVQIPQSLTSQQIQFQDTRFLNQLQNSTSMIGIQPLSLTTQPQINQHLNGNDPNSYYTTSVVLPNLPVSNIQFQQTQNESILNHNIQNDSSLDQQKHWRPW